MLCDVVTFDVKREACGYYLCTKWHDIKIDIQWKPQTTTLIEYKKDDVCDRQISKSQNHYCILKGQFHCSVV